MSSESFGSFWNSAPKSSRTNIAEALKFLTNVMKKKAIVFVLSDFIADDYNNTLRIVGNKHDVTGIRVYDEREESIPNLGMVQMQDAETGTLQLVNTQSKKSTECVWPISQRQSELFYGYVYQIGLWGDQLQGG